MTRLLTRRDGAQVLVPLGFSWWCFFFGSVYGLCTSNWTVVIAHLGTNLLFAIMLALGCPGPLVSVCSFAVNVFIAHMCNPWRLEALRERGFEG